MKFTLKPGAEFEVATADEIRAVMEETVSGYLRPPGRVRIEQTIKLDGSGNGTAQVAQAEAGYVYLINRLIAEPWSATTGAYSFAAPYIPSTTGGLDLKLDDKDVVDGYQFGNVAVDFRKAEVTRDGQLLDLAAREFQLLRYFVEHRGATLTREELLNEVWGYNAMPSTRTVDVHVAWLRQKLEPVPKYPQFILTVHGLGYKFAG